MFVVKGRGAYVRLIAGVFVLLSVILGFVVNTNFFYFTGFVGIMQIVSATTGFCPMESILKFVGVE